MAVPHPQRRLIGCRHQGPASSRDAPCWPSGLRPLRPRNEHGAGLANPSDDGGLEEFLGFAPTWPQALRSAPASAQARSQAWQPTPAAAQRREHRTWPHKDHSHASRNVTHRLLVAAQGADVGVIGGADAFPASRAVLVGAVPSGSAVSRVAASARWRPVAGVRGLLRSVIVSRCLSQAKRCLIQAVAPLHGGAFSTGTASALAPAQRYEPTLAVACQRDGTISFSLSTRSDGCWPGTRSTLGEFAPESPLWPVAWLTRGRRTCLVRPLERYQRRRTRQWA